MGLKFVFFKNVLFIDIISSKDWSFNILCGGHLEKQNDIHR